MISNPFKWLLHRDKSSVLEGALVDASMASLADEVFQREASGCSLDVLEADLHHLVLVVVTKKGRKEEEIRSGEGGRRVKEIKRRHAHSKSKSKSICLLPK
ncbi:hypothetical protein Cni_G15518 [Canna indica]|uniref:Uncharacterized protein n=1 Tax=Canna indica TaxID=4628 RepID=A0AAQ3KEL1_9LILI|nr:hypothetical protein Cni_G15518 [Canna indica]